MKHKRSLFINVIFLAAGLAAAVFLSQLNFFSVFLAEFGRMGYLGVFLSGIFFVLSFTAALAGLVLIKFSATMPMILVSLIAGLGGAAGDLLIFGLVRNGFKAEAKKAYRRSFFLRWLLPIVGALIIASPLPDEIGVTLMGITNIKPKRFMLVSFLLNSLGIFLLLKGAAFFR